MNMDTKNKTEHSVHAFILSAVISAVAIVVLTIGGELYPPLKNFLAKTFTHHWVGKSVISFVGFCVLGFLLRIFVHRGRDSAGTLLFLLFWVGCISALAIFGFFYYETFLATH